MVQEGGIAAKLQLVEEISEANGFTVSGDGTTIRHLNYETKHITLNVASTRFFGVIMGPNHKSETQLHSWKELSNNYYDTFNRAFGPDGKHADPLTFAKDMLGLRSDHSEDQKKLNRLLREWKELSGCIWRGKDFMAKSPVQDFAQTLWEVSVEKIAAVGGLDKWGSLSNDAKDKHDQEAYRKLCLRIGQEQRARFPEDARRGAQLWVRAGCCTHKEMDSTKGGAAALTAYWNENDLTPPIKLFNKDNAAAVAAGPSAAMDRALSLSEGGTVKLASLAGALFNNKDEKKGLQDTHRDYFRRLLGYAINFPNTSNTRFESHLLAVAELLVHLPLYIDLLLEVRDCKEKGNFIHMEYNIYQDTPTLTEMAALTFWPSTILTCVLVKDHCHAIINNPDLQLGAEADFAQKAMDGSLITLPHLRGCVVAFFKDALSTWERFTTEFAPIASLTGVEKKRLFINATNEDALGTTPENTFAANSRRRDTACFCAKKHGSWMDSDSKMKGDKYKQYYQGKATEKRTKVAEKKQKEHEYQSVLDSLVPELDIETLKVGLTAAGKTTTVPQIKLQIEWHRRFDVEKMISKKALTNVMRRTDLLVQLIAAAERYNRAPALTHAETETLEMDIEPDLEMDWAEKDEEHDANMAAIVVKIIQSVAVLIWPG
ncbi:hypothetical protein CVT26_014292 [Gymnopilus dilepis]|uniref:Uncharacterized protein n=1 Tax=Gymnopilus dilepis TaxID=231916 RepID=A0A409X1Y6_9AGAR|nr:hypothetical protein CVT26_014292 [Gymnopilus dilepis]